MGSLPICLKLLAVALVLIPSSECQQKGKLGKGAAATPTKSNILFAAPVGSKSHKNFYYGIIEAIAKEGHSVTVLTPYKPSKTIPNVEEVVYEENDMKKMSPNVFKDGQLAPIWKILTNGPQTCFQTLKNPKTQEVMKKKFDLVFVSMFFSDCLLPTIHAHQIPFVFVSPAQMVGPMSGWRMGSPVFPSFDSNPMFAFTQPYSFCQRTVLAVSSLAMYAIQSFVTHRTESIGREIGVIPSDSPSIDSIAANASLMIFNSFRLAEHPRPYMPNMLLLGGIHCRPPKPLPQDLEKWVQSAGDAGIIYFSLGSHVRSSDLPESSVQLLLSVFKSLPQKVLWKYDKEYVDGLPENVRLTKWAPQQDLLGHPSMRLFISHGGLLSTQEATYHGVPVVGLPVFGDQKGNMNDAEVQGWGKRLDWDTLTAEILSDAIQELISDPEKRANVKTLSSLMQDRQLQPADEIAWWTSYLLRTRGARHLRSGAADLSWWQIYNVDVYLVLLVVDMILLVVSVKLMRMLWRRCCGSNSKRSKKKVKKN